MKRMPKLMAKKQAKRNDIVEGKQQQEEEGKN